MKKVLILFITLIGFVIGAWHSHTLKSGMTYTNVQSFSTLMVI